MAIPVNCPSCGAEVNAPDNLAGRTVKCPKCSAPMKLPAASGTADAIQAESPAAAVPPPPPERARPSRRSRDDDDRDYDDNRSRDYDDDVVRRSPSSVNGLAIAGMVLGIVGFIVSFIPCFGWVLGLVLGIVGATLSGIGMGMAGKAGSGKGMAIAGLILSILAIVWGPAWFFIYVRTAAQAVQQAIQNNPAFILKDKQIQFQPNIVVQGPPTPASGKVTLKDGQATLQGNLAANDPRDRMRQASACKVFTINMAAGKTYEINMIHSNDGLDPYLRLEDPAGLHLTQDDDGGGFPNARMVFNCTKAGEYRIVATSFAGSVGNFTLTVSEK